MDFRIDTDSKRGKWAVFGFVAVGVFMSTLDGSIVNIALPVIMKDFGVSFDLIEWVLVIYLLTVSSLLLSFGRLSDIKGRRWVYSRGLIVFSIGSLCCAMSPSAYLLIAARSFQGVGASMVMSCTPALIIDTFPANERGKALGMVGAVVASGLTVGPALGGWVAHAFSWRMIFYINIPIGILTAGAVSFFLKGSRADFQREEPFDWKGALLLVIGCSSFLYSAAHGHKSGYAFFPIGVLFILAILTIVGLVRIEPNVSHPVIDPSLLTIRMFTLPLMSAMILFASLFTIVFLMPFFLTIPCGFTIQKAGHFMVTPFLFLFLFAPVSGALSDRIGSRMLCTIGMAILCLALTFLSRLSPDDSALSIAWPLALSGLGTAIFIAPNSSAIMSAVPKPRMGIAAGMVATVRNLGMVLGIAIAGTVFNTVFIHESGGIGLKKYTPDLLPVFMSAFRSALLAGTVTAGVGTVVSFLRGHENKEKNNE